ncbi:MAG: ABC transporter permease [Patescibacteria group bacterium]
MPQLIIHYLRLITATLKKNRRRTFLTMLGIIIGVSAVIFINSVGAGAQSLIFNQIKGVGSNLIGILPGGSEEDGPPASVMGIIITTLTNDDALAIAKLIPHAESVTSYVKGTGTLHWQAQTADLNFNGVSASYIKTEDTEVGEGRFFTEDEARDLSRVIVLGSQITKDLFGDQDPLGQTVRLKKENFRVIGVMKARGTAGFQNYDTEIFIPLLTAQKLLLGIKHISFMRVKIDQKIYLDDSVEQIKQILRDRHNIRDAREDDFSVRNQAQALQVLGSVTDALRLFMTAIAALGLLVGGIGIMNIMLVAVNERIHEIGLRKAVGATYKNILWQFLLETTFISFFAGAIGIILGIILSFLAAVIVRQLDYDWDFVVSWQSIVLGFGASCAVGLIFGIYPARQAARLEPMEALRYE